MRKWLALLLLPAGLGAQEPDTVRAEMVLPIPVQMQVVGDTTVVDVRVEVATDSLAALAERVWLARQSELALHGQLQACCAQDSGPPGWFYVGALLVGAGAVLAYAAKEERQTWVNVEQSQSQDVTVTERWPFYWPPGWWRGPWRKRHDRGKGHGGGE